MDTSKLVRCERHGTFYNPDTYDACAICRSGEERDRSQSAGGLRFSPFRIAGALGVVLGAFFLLGKATRALGDRGEAVAAAAAVDPRLDPQPYREALENLERLVYAERARPYGQGTAIMQAAYDLSQEIRPVEGAGSLALARRQQYGMEILSFGQQQVAVEDVGYAAFDLATAQSAWEAVRASVFQEADWFQTRGTATLAAATGPRNVMSPATVRMLEDLATSLENTARFGRQQAMRIGEMTGDHRSSEMQRVQSAWDSFRQSLNTRLSSAVNGLPAGGVLVSNDAGRAHQYLEQAVQSMASLVRYTSVPTRSSRESAFDNADRSIREAKRVLAQL